jgi:hypothetical protein
MGDECNFNSPVLAVYVTTKVRFNGGKRIQQAGTKRGMGRMNES